MAKPRSITAAGIQTHYGPDMAENIARTEAFVREAARRGAQVILPSELFQGIYFCTRQDPKWFLTAYSVETHPCVLAMQRLAHRKSHIPDGPGYQEKYYFRPGDTGFRVWKTQAGTIGVGICWDQWYPECARAMVLQGAEILFYPTAIGSEPYDAQLDTHLQWQRAMQGHAVSNAVPIVAANRIGLEDNDGVKQRFYGHSFITDHLGVLPRPADGSLRKKHHLSLEIELQLLVAAGRARCRRERTFLRKPPEDGSHDVLHVSIAERRASGDAVPFREAPPATRRGRVLGNEDGVTAHRRLPPIVLRLGGSKPLPCDVARVPGYDLAAVFVQIGAFLRPEPEPPAKRRGGERFKNFVERPHGDRVRSRASAGENCKQWRPFAVLWPAPCPGMPLIESYQALRVHH